MILLETKRLIIRDHKLEDLSEYHNLISNDINMYYLPEIKTTSLEESSISLKEAIYESELGSNRKKYFLGIFKNDSSYIGEIGYTVTSASEHMQRAVNLGYFIKEEFWGKGYVTEALKEILKFAFTKDEVDIIETGCLTINKGSENVMIKTGFTKKSLKLQFQKLNDELYDRVEYSLTREEFKNLRF